MQRLFIIGSCPFKLAQGVIGLPAHPVECGRWSHREVMGSPQCSSHMLDSSAGRRQRQGFFSQELPVFERLWPHPGCRAMSSQIGQVCLAQSNRGTEGFKRFRDGPVQGCAFTRKQVLVDRLPRQRVPESKQLRRLFHDQLGRNQLLDEREQIGFITVQHLLQDGKIKAPSRHSRER